MPSPEEFGSSGGEVHSVGAAPRTVDGRPDLEALKNRARMIREAQARGVPIPATGTAMAPRPTVDTPYAGATRSAPISAPTYVAPSPSGDEELELVRTRFKLANYYEALLEQPAFGDDVNTDPYAAQVQSELTDWVKGRMSELVGIRNNPEGFLDDEVQLLKSLVQQLGPNGIKAVTFLADRVLNPPAAAPLPPVTTDLSGVHGQTSRRASLAPVPQAEAAPEEDADDQGGSAGFLSPEPQPPQPPQVALAKPKRPYVRRAKIPGAPVATQASTPDGPVPTETVQEPPQKRGRKRSDDPLAAGKAAVAAGAQSEAPIAPTVQPGTPAAPNAVQPVPMPRGRNMEMAMEQKAGEALRNTRVIEATGGGVL